MKEKVVTILHKREARMLKEGGGKMKKIFATAIAVAMLFLSVVVHAEGIDGVWEAEGSHAVFELVLRQHEGKVFGAVLAKTARGPWTQFTVVEGKIRGREMNLIVLAEGCDGGGGADEVIIKGVLMDGDGLMKAIIRLIPRCFSGEEELLFHKE